MNDRFKFRVWNKEQKKLYQWDELLKNKEDNTFYWCMLQAQNNEENNILMQCTGRKDQNGVLIYEGDIVERDNTDGVKRGVVEFSDCFVKFRATNMSKFSLLERAVVIGNIYENKELLETFTKYGYLKKLQECDNV